MYVNQATFALLESFVFRSNICSIMQRSSRKSPYSHTFVRYQQAEERKALTIRIVSWRPTLLSEIKNLWSNAAHS